MIGRARRLVRRGGGVSSTARVLTDRPERYGKQLTSHMSRRHGGEWSPESASGWMRLGSGRATVRAEQGVLVLEVSCESAEEIAGLEDAVGRHLVKFGAKDGLVVAWRRSDGTTGTKQPAVS